jgi:hypothetical protein
MLPKNKDNTNKGNKRYKHYNLDYYLISKVRGYNKYKSYKYIVNKYPKKEYYIYKKKDYINKDYLKRKSYSVYNRDYPTYYYLKLKDKSFYSLFIIKIKSNINNNAKDKTYYWYISRWMNCVSRDSVT